MNVTIQVIGHHKLVLNLAQVDDTNVHLLDSILDAIGEVIGQDADDIFVRTDVDAFTSIQRLNILGLIVGVNFRHVPAGEVN